MAFFASIIGVDLRTRFWEIDTRFIRLPTCVIYSHCSLSHTFPLLAPSPRAIYSAEANEPVVVACISFQPFCDGSLHCDPLSDSFHSNQVCPHITTLVTGHLPRDVSVNKSVVVVTSWEWTSNLNIKGLQLFVIPIKLYLQVLVTATSCHCSKAYCGIHVTS